MGQTYKTQRSIDPFFEEAVNQVYLRPEKQIYLMHGPVGIGKTSNFTLRGPYQLAQHVVPIDRDGVMVRESVWAAIRESENSAVATIMETITDSMFPPDVVYKPDGPVRKVGAHPTHIVIEHNLPDGTHVKMDIECHGFNNQKAEDRLRSRSYVGAIIPEVQGIPWAIVEVARQRTGRWRPGHVRIEKIINGKKHILSGTQKLKLVFADGNIPKRPHAMYDVLYDPPTLRGTPYHVISPPAPILPIPIEKASKAAINKYPTTVYDRKKVVWVPNPIAYHMTRHFETVETDPSTGDIITNPDGSAKTVPWSGYNYWFAELQQSDSIIRRHIIGKPDQVGGASAVYPNFNREEQVLEKTFIKGGTVYIGWDPGKYAAFVFIQIHDGVPHVFHEITFEPEDGQSTRMQLEHFVKPFIDDTLRGASAYIIPDPAAAFSTASGEAPIAVAKSMGLQIQLCKVANQDTDTRVNSLGYFIDSRLMTVSPSCVLLITALSGGYSFKMLRSGLVSNMVDKNEYCHVAESAQYPFVNIYKMLIEKRNGRKSNYKISKLKHIRK